MARLFTAYRIVARLGIVLAVALGIPATASAGPAATAISRVHVVGPLSLSDASPLSFGSVALNRAVGTMSLSPDGTITTEGVVVSNLNQVESASFNMVGDDNQTYVISFPTTVSFVSRDDSLSVTSFTHDAGDTPTLGHNGNSQFNIGATLNLQNNQPNGIYDGFVNVIISNN